MTDIPAARKEIERIDAEIIRLVAARQECARVIGENKRAAGTNVFVPEREEALLRKLENIAAGLNIPAASIRAIFREIISASVALQMDGLPVVYLGPEGTFTHQAARKNFGGSVRLQPLRTIAEIFEAVERGKAGYGVIPIENSNAGAVTGALDMLAESDLKIIAQIQLAVEQCLISRAPLEKIERVLSKDLGLAQCSQWLMHHLPNAALIPTDSTAAAVLKAAEDESAAAIASAVAAEIHGVPVVEKGIQNRPENYTRFFVIGKKPNPPCSSCEEKTSLVVSIKNEPGSLLKMLEPFSKRGIDLVSIESRPSRRRAWEYLFFIDLIGSWDAPDLRDAVAELERRSIFVKHLGSYPNLKN